MLKIRIVLKLGLFHHLETLQEACKSQLVKLETRNPVKVKATFIIVKSFRKQGSSNWSRILILARNMLFQSFEKFQEASKSKKATICLERFSCCKQEIMIRGFGQQHVHFDQFEKFNQGLFHQPKGFKRGFHLSTSSTF